VSVARAAGPKAALVKIAVAYVKFGIENPAHYRLMFGSALMPEGDNRPDIVMLAGDSARGVLEDIIARGVRQGVFSPSPQKKFDIEMAALTAMSAVHGLTLLVIDGHAHIVQLPVEKMAERMARMFCDGLVRK
jgi:Tetracyclin repressor-like, C-terminal domain